MSPRRFRHLFRPELAGMEPYAAEAQIGKVRLDANESPFSLAPEVRREIMKALSRVPTNRYPDPEARELKAAVAAWLKVEPDWVLLGNGSDEIISLLAAAVSVPGARALVPVPSFSMYALIAQGHGLAVDAVPLDERFDLRMEEMRAALARRPRIVFLGYPNNPTGVCYSRTRINEVIDLAPGLVVIDEAYGDYSGKSYLSNGDRHRNVVVLRTVSKIGLAALRLGVMAAHPDIVREIEKIRLPYNINSLTQTVARIALSHPRVLSAQVKKVVRERDRLMEALEWTRGLSPYPTEANFILFRTVGDAEAIHSGLLSRGVVIRNLSRTPALKNCLRVTIGTPAENKAFLEAIQLALKEIQ